MALQLDIETPSGATATYHKITDFSFKRTIGLVTGNIEGFLNEDICKANGQSLTSKPFAFWITEQVSKDVKRDKESNIISEELERVTLFTNKSTCDEIIAALYTKLLTLPEWEKASSN